MKKIYTIIFIFMLLAGWTGCQTVEPEVPSIQTELIAMQGSYVVTKFIDGSTYTLKLKDKDGNVKEMSLKKDEATSVKEEHGQIVIVFKDGSRATFHLENYLDINLSATEVSLAKSDSVVVTFTLKADSFENIGVQPYESDNVNVSICLNEGKDGGSLLFRGKGIASFKEDVIIRFTNNGSYTDMVIPTSRLRFGWDDGKDSKTYNAVGEGESVEWSLLGGIKYEVENNCDWIEIVNAKEDYINVRFLENDGGTREAEIRLISEDKEAVTLSVIQTISQRTVLMKLYEATNGDKWMENRNWGSDRPLQEWFGIRTTDGHVTEIELTGNHLEGTLPDELFELVYLERLVLDSPRHHNTYDDSDMENWNLISGDLNELGPKIGKLTNLKELDFNGLVNITCGDIPDEIWMPQIERIVLSQLPIKGCITPAIGNATNLRYLDIDRNNRKTDIHGTIPTEITKLKHLEYLDLMSNRHLTGSLPENIGDMNSLEVLYLSDCALTGTIPESIFNLKKIHSLWLNSNFLKGTFDLSRLTTLPKIMQCLVDYNNYLQGIGDVPNSIELVCFDRDGYNYRYSFGVMTREPQPDYCWQHTDEYLEKRLAEE